MSPQKRNRQNQGLPAGWRKRKGFYWLRTTKRNRHLFDDKAEFRLGRTLSEAYRVYGARIEATHVTDTMPRLLDRYELEVTPTKAESTQDKERKRIQKLRHMFRDFDVAQVRPHHCYKARDMLASAHGKTTANRHMETLSHALTKAVEWGTIHRHPMIEAGFRKLSVDVSRHVPEHWEIDEALKVAPPLIAAYIGLKRQTGLRMGDMLALRREDIRDDGLYVRPRKTQKSSGKAQLWEIDDELRAALDACLELQKGPKRIAGQHLFCTRKGQPYTPDGFASIWQRWMRKALADTALECRFKERSIRTYVGTHSESDQDAADRMGHTSTSTAKRFYRERPTAVKPLKVKE